MKNGKIMKELKRVTTLVMSAAMLVTQMPMTSLAADSREAVESYAEDEALQTEMSGAKQESTPDGSGKANQESSVETSGAKQESTPNESGKANQESGIEKPEAGQEMPAAPQPEAGEAQPETGEPRTESPTAGQEGSGGLEAGRPESTESAGSESESAAVETDETKSGEMGGTESVETDVSETETAEAESSESEESEMPEEELAYDEDFVIEGKTLKQYRGSEKEIRIPEGIEIIDAGVFKDKPIEKITLPSSLKKIGNSAFRGVPFGKEFNGEVIGESITIPASVEEIGVMAFKDCKYLKEVFFEDSGTGSLVIADGYNNDDGVFYNCPALLTVELPARLTKVGKNAFNSCTALETLEFGEGSNVEEIGSGAFENCSKLGRVSLPDKVTTIGVSAFRRCALLREVKLNNGLKSIGDDAFRDSPLGKLVGGNIAASSVTIPGSVTKIGVRAFSGCIYLKTLTFENGSSNLLKIDDGYAGDDGAFYNCTALETVTLPDRLEKVGKNAFNRCTALKTVALGQNLVEIGISSFEGCVKLESVALPAEVTTIGARAFYDCKALTSLTLNGKLETIGNDAFRNAPLGTKDANNNITSVKLTFPGTLSSIGERAFSECTYLGEVIFENGDTGSLIIANGYAGDDGVFYKCESLKKATLPDRLREIGSNAFYRCTGLEEVHFGKRLKKINYSAFYGCTSLTGVSLKDEVTEIGNEAFRECTSLTTLELGNEIQTIGVRAFNNAPLGTAAAPGTVVLSGTLTSVGYGAFAGCSNLGKIEFLDGDVSGLILNAGYDNDDGMFYNCTKLQEVRLPYRIRELRRHIFVNCTALEKIYIPGELTSIDERAFVNWSAALNVYSKSDGKADLYFRGKPTGIIFHDITENAVSGIEIFPISFAAKGKSANGTKFYISRRIEPFNAQNKAVTYASSNESVATVDDAGEVTIKRGYGTATITVTTADGNKSATCEVTVTAENEVSVTGVSVEPAAIRRSGDDTLGYRERLEAKVMPANATDKSVKYETADPNVATVDRYGTVTFRGYGTTTITVTTIDGEFKATCVVSAAEVPKAVTGVTMEPAEIKLSGPQAIGVKRKLDVKVLPEDAANKNVTYESSNPNAATVDETGEVTIVGAGAAVIKVKTADGAYTAECKVSVKAEAVRVTGVAIDAGSKVIRKAGANVQGQTHNITVEVLPEDAADKTVTFESDKPEVATVDAEGLVTIVGYGKAVITAKTTDGAFTDTCEVLVSETVTHVTSVSVTPSTIVKWGADALGATQELDVTVKPDDATDQTVSFSSDKPDVAAVDTNGLVTITGYGEATITVASSDDASKKAECRVSVSEKPIMPVMPVLNGENTDIKFAKNMTAYPYTGMQIRPTMTVKYKYTDDNGNSKWQTLKLNVDYAISYANNIDKGSAQAAIIGIGEYAGSVTMAFNITQKSIKKVTLSPVGDILYSADPKLNVTVMDGNIELKENKDYTLEFDHGKPDQDTQVTRLTIKGCGNYNEEIIKNVKFNIIGSVTAASGNIKPITDATIDYKDKTKTYTYNGKPQKPALTVTGSNGRKLSSSQYKIIYADNVNAGEKTGIVRVVGVSKNGTGYYGMYELPVKFDIAKKDFSKLSAQSTLTIPKAGTISDIKNAIQKAVAVKDGSRVLMENEYEVDFATPVDKCEKIPENYSSIKIGTNYAVVIKPTAGGNYFENQNKKKVVKIKFSQLNLASKTARVEVKLTSPNAQGVTVTYNDFQLKQGTDYTVAKFKQKANKFEFVIKAASNKTCPYKGSITKKGLTVTSPAQ